MSTPDLFTGPELRDAALARVAAHADPDFMAAALAAVERVAATRDEFTTDHVWVEIGTAQTHERRAMGAVMRQAMRLKIVAPTTLFRPSDQAQCHGRPMRVWRRAVA